MKFIPKIEISYQSLNHSSFQIVLGKTFCNTQNRIEECNNMQCMYMKLWYQEESKAGLHRILSDYFRNIYQTTSKIFDTLWLIVNDFTDFISTIFSLEPDELDKMLDGKKNIFFLQWKLSTLWIIYKRWVKFSGNNIAGFYWRMSRHKGL